MMTRKTITNGLTVALVAMGIVGMTAGTANAALLLATDFLTTTPATDVATTGLTNIIYTDGRASLFGPDDLLATDTSEANILITNLGASSHFVPNQKVQSGPWDVDILLTVNAVVNVTHVILDRQNMTNTANANTSLPRGHNLIVTLSGASAGQVGQVTQEVSLAGGQSEGDVTFNFGSPVTLNTTDTWTLSIRAINTSGGGGYWVGLDGFEVHGSDPQGTLIMVE